VATRGGGSPASPLDSAPGHHLVHELVHFIAEARAHVAGGSRGVIVPRRRPAPEGVARLLRRACERAKVHKKKGI
jgi:hypothetical protein